MKPSMAIRQSTPLPMPSTPISVEDAEMTTINQKLKELGIENTIQLPQICVIGDQSTGKSSLIEALSMIKVPRAAGCCTHCPLEVNLVKAENSLQLWNCRVSLVKKYDFAQSAATRPTQDRPLGGNWKPLGRIETTKFADCNSSEDVCNLILRAQAAVLNPSQNPNIFVTGEIPSEFEVKFSPNAVSLDILQHDLPSLSFIDLPGLVTHQDEQYLVGLVDKLVSQYAKSERSIILLTLSMTSDYDTSKALGIVTKLRADKRTLAVMTKPDLYPKQDDINKFLGMLMGESGPKMRHGYHVVMMDPDVSLDHAAAMQKEAQFFSTHEYWASLEPNYREKVDTQKLSRRLSILLQQATRESLPSSLERIENRLAEVERKLQDLPTPPGIQHMSITLNSLIMEFGNRMLKLFEDGGNSEKFLLKSAWDRLAKSFRKNLLESQPLLKVGTRAEVAQREKAEQVTAEVITLVDEDSPSPPPSRRTANPTSPQHHTFRLEDVRKTNQRHATPGLTAQIFPGAVFAMMRKSVANFDGTLETFIEATFNLIKENIDEQASTVFNAFKSMPLYMAVKKHIHACVSDYCDKQREESLRMCKMEQMKPYTLDGETSIKATGIHLENLVKSRAEYRLKVAKAIHDAEHASRSRRPEFRKKVEDLDPDEWGTEIELVARVRAYHQIAASRFADNICQSINAHMFPRLARELAESLAEFLGPTDPEKHDMIVEWMSENPERELERSRLIDEQASLLEAWALVKGALGCMKRKRNSVMAELDDDDDDDDDNDDERSYADDVDMYSSGTEAGEGVAATPRLGQKRPTSSKLRNVKSNSTFQHASIEDEMDEN